MGPENINFFILASSLLALFIYLLLMVQLPEKLLRAKMGLSVMTAGVLGNGIDRFIFQMTTDFISLPGLHFAFNFADICLWTGLLLYLWIFLNNYVLENEPRHRMKLLIIPSDQLRFARVLAGLFFCSGIIFGVFAAAFFKIYHLTSLFGGDKLLLDFFLTYLSFTSLLSGIFFFFCLHFSHRLMGPVYSFINHLKRKDAKNFKVRQGDFFTILEGQTKEDLSLVAMTTSSEHSS
jgi:hypothetical protein